MYESIVHHRPDVVFGIDLRKWAGEGGWNAVRVTEDQKEPADIPNVAAGLLAGVNEAYEKLPNDSGKFEIYMLGFLYVYMIWFSERRKCWIYDVCECPYALFYVTDKE